MHQLNALIRDIPIPHRMQRLPLSERGFPIPWFVYIDDKGVSDFRVIGPGKFNDAMKHRKCWLCGNPLGTHMVFVIGPMCTVNRVSAEPPSHLDCAQYAAKACPFLTNPRAKRNEKDMPEDGVEPGGVMIRRNPGVTALWVTRSYKPFRVDNGVLIRIGEAERVEWYAEGRFATKAEVMASITSGFPLLEAEAKRGGPDELRELNKCLLEATRLLPAA